MTDYTSQDKNDFPKERVERINRAIREASKLESVGLLKIERVRQALLCYLGIEETESE